MQTKLARWATGVLSVVGVVLVAAFFLAWVQFGDTSGFGLAWDGERWLFLVPIAGLILATAAATNAAHTRIAAIGAGLLVAGDVMFDLLRGILHGGLDLWLILGGAAIVLAGIGEKNRGLRAVGGAAVLAGFFAPWTSNSLFHALWDYGADLGIRELWLIPLGALGAVVSAGVPGASGKRLAAASGIAVFGSLVWMMASVASMIFAWGAWITLGASAVALAIGVLGPTGGAAVAAVTTKKAAAAAKD